MTRKTLSRATAAPTAHLRREENPRKLTSEHVAEHLAAFEAAGGKVEVLSTTQVLKRVQATAVGDAGGA